MTTIKPAYVAGMFYPEAREILQATVLQLLKTATPPSSLSAPKALIAPHAGYIYSGSVAATIYATLTSKAKLIRRVLLFGPAHQVAFQGIATTQVDAFQTPLSNVPVDHLAIASAIEEPCVQYFESAFANEHCLEVQLPFLQNLLDDFQIVPFIVGEAAAEDVATVMLKLWGGEETLIVVSSDLSHYHDYETARQIDATTNQAILDMAPSRIGYQQACGRRPIQGLLLAAQEKHLTIRSLDLRNSGDTAGPKERVVGYGAYHLG